jgi:hypothetical protein
LKTKSYKLFSDCSIGTKPTILKCRGKCRQAVDILKAVKQTEYEPEISWGNLPYREVADTEAG